MIRHGQITAGSTKILGATPSKDGVNFAVHAGLPATKVELCLFHPEREERIALPEKDGNNIFHGFVPGLQAGAIYGYRVHGPWAPEKGHVFNPNKLLLDPYAKSIAGRIDWTDGVVHGYRFDKDHPGRDDHDLIFDDRDSAIFMPKGRVIDWQAQIAEAVCWREENKIPHGSSLKFKDLAIMEAHIKGASKRHPEGDGTYKSMAHRSFVDLIKGGINMLELMPVHSFPPIESTGNPNFWGYMTLNYFTPNNYASSENPLKEFVEMVQALRKNGIEVMMDVVYNHTAEGNHRGPHLSFKGFDSFIYRHNKDNPRFYFDTTSCGNSLDFNHPMARRVVVESLEYFVQLGVTAFRFDLGVTLGREGPDGAYNEQAKLFQEIEASPILVGKVHKTGEPWDLNQPDSYQLGNTPAFAGWNGKYRDFVREATLSNNGADPSTLAKCMTGSPHIFGKSPNQGVNFITAHDGRTLADLTAVMMGYPVEELKDRKAFMSKLRAEPGQLNIFHTRQQFALSVLALSIGVPMIPHGHGRGHSQHGNHDAYNVDGKSTWINTVLGEDWQKNMLQFTKEVFEFRRRHPEIQRDTFFTGQVDPETGKKDITFYTPEGKEMEPHDWAQGQAFCYVVAGQKTAEKGPDDKPIYKPDLVVMVNGGHEKIDFKLPPLKEGVAVQALNSAHLGGDVDRPSIHESGSAVAVTGRSLVALESGRMRSVDISPVQRTESFVR